MLISLFLQWVSSHAQHQQLQSDQRGAQTPRQRAAGYTATLHPHTGRTGSPLPPVPPHSQDVWQGTWAGRGVFNVIYNQQLLNWLEGKMHIFCFFLCFSSSLTRNFWVCSGRWGWWWTGRSQELHQCRPPDRVVWLERQVLRSARHEGSLTVTLLFSIHRSLSYGADTLEPLTDVKSKGPSHFLWRAGDPAAWCMMDRTQRVDGPTTLSEFS